jgi:hypothetical protein
MARKRIRDEFARAMVRWISSTSTELTFHVNNSTYHLGLPFILLLLSLCQLQGLIEGGVSNISYLPAVSSIPPDSVGPYHL